MLKALGNLLDRLPLEAMVCRENRSAPYTAHAEALG
jgi:hypothetical protein